MVHLIFILNPTLRATTRVASRAKYSHYDLGHTTYSNSTNDFYQPASTIVKSALKAKPKHYMSMGGKGCGRQT